MAIVKNDIKESIKSMMSQISSTDLPQEDAIDLVADQWADIIKSAIESATISGIVTTGSATTQTQTPGTGTLS
tara:strand:- start:1626 stop:1844 length:219 start_codon:yes stop_codon:yes gene_type:complete